MGLMDKVKAQANTLAQKTQETANAGKARLDMSQANRRSDGLLRSLGLAVLAERTGRAAPETQAQIDQLIADLTAHETQHGVNLVQQAMQAQQMQMGPGDFLTSSDPAFDPNVSAAPPPGAAPAYCRTAEVPPIVTVTGSAGLGSGSDVAEIAPSAPGGSV